MKAKEPKYEIKVRVTQAQLDKIHENMRLVHLENREEYLRKMALNGYVLFLDDRELRCFNRLIGSISNSFNQIAKRANDSGLVYETDLMDMSSRMNQIWEAQNKLLAALEHSVVLFSAVLSSFI